MHPQRVHLSRGRGGRRAWWLGVAALVVACEAEPEPEPEPEPRESAALTDPYVWMQTPAAEDPFVWRRSGQVSCDPVLGSGPEVFGGVPAFAVDTGWCNFVTVEQLAGADLRAGDRIEIQIWHGDLTASAPAEGYVGLALGDEVVWEQTVPIPSPGALLQGEIEVTEDWPPDVLVRYHVDNHGANTYDLLTLVRHPADDEG